MKKILKLYHYLIIILMISVISQPVNAENLQMKDNTNTIEFENIVDNYMKKALEKYHVPATTLVVVKDGKIILNKGYGVSNLDSKNPVDSNNSIFRIGSVSKIITATAVMQLVEQEKIDLNMDINNYLKDFTIETKYDKPITMFHLLTHTAGFDEKIIGINRKDLSEPKPLGMYLKMSMPTVIREPGEVIQYSNHGMALAGYIVEEVSGIPFSNYIEDNILSPLDMNNSSYNINSFILENMTSAYEFKENKYIEVEPYNINMPPVGAFNTTSGDMAKFLIAHLQNGRYGDLRILQEDTVINMQSQQFVNHEDMLGMAFGFYENTREGCRVIEHGGAIPPFMSFISLQPEKNLGFFISTNSSSGKNLIEEFTDLFYEYFIKKEQVSEDSTVSSALNIDLNRYEGVYKKLRVPRTTILLSYDSVEIHNNKNTSLILKEGKKQEKFIWVKDDLFKNPSNNTYIAFKENKNGKLYLVFSPNVFKTYEKMDENKIVYDNVISYLFYLAIIIALIVCVAWIIKIIRKKKYTYKGMTYLGQLLSKLNCLLILGFVGGFFMFLSKNSLTQSLEINWLLIATLCIGIVIASITCFLIFFSCYIWKNRIGTVWNRIYYTICTLASVGFVLFINELNLLGFKF